MSADDWIIGGAFYVLLTLAWISITIVLARNAVSVVQLLTAAYVFVRRIKPAPQSSDLWSRYDDLTLPVSVIAPAFNEELSIVNSVRGFLALEYPDHEVIVVNDGSSDATLKTLIDAFEMVPVDRVQEVALQRTRIIATYASPLHPKLLVVDKENGRKADAANAGIGFAQKPLVCVIDADSIIESDGLLRATEPFMGDNGELVAVGGAIRVVNGSVVRRGHVSEIGLSPHWLPRFQAVEYLRAFLTARVANAHLSMLLLISGAFGIFKRSVLIEVGGYRHDTVGEDLELVTRIHRFMRENKRGYKITFVPDVVCWTETPETPAGLRNQRSRWEQGAIETLVRHRHMLFNPRYGRIGTVGLPILLLEDVLGPPLELIGYAVIPVCYMLDMLSSSVALAFLSLTLVFGTAISVGTLALEESQLRRTPRAADLARIAAAAILENFGYRQANLAFRLRGIWRYLQKDPTWAAVPRLGFGDAGESARDKTSWPFPEDRREASAKPSQQSETPLSEPDADTNARPTAVGE